MLWKVFNDFAITVVYPNLPAEAMLTPRAKWQDELNKRVIHLLLILLLL